MTQVLAIAFDRAVARRSCVGEAVLAMPGMSGRCYRMFINNLVRMTPEARYLEVGSWAGSTACSAMHRNVARVTCIDNWSQFGGPKDHFMHNVASVMTNDIQFGFIENDFRAVETTQIGRYNIYLFDGPHERQDQYDGLALYDPALDDDVYFIVDDWNWQPVRHGTFDAIEAAGFAIDYAIEIRTTLDNSHAEASGENGDWHNGYFLSKLSRRKRQLYPDGALRPA
ncbi:class I SAM-dependent methyltransferase [Methylobacterium sp. Leaf118]|uniref:class I SAM-dependent methyltransferase n=1 Tax=Methylobacterium sp. Leaf118 TaxID=2876562 RepID=UPI001E35E8F2|nr:class I SAM-dependent methyltransferase [Methylobacterium sp. Leaf118]